MALSEIYRASARACPRAEFSLDFTYHVVKRKALPYSGSAVSTGEET